MMMMPPGRRRVTHLEELCFWLFLVNSGSVQQDWFRSLYFKTWIVGSVIAITYMPLVTIFTRSDPLKVRFASAAAAAASCADLVKLMLVPSRSVKRIRFWLAAWAVCP